MPQKDYSKLEKDELLKVIEKLESRKKYGLIWDEEKTKEKFEKDAENALPVLKEVKGKEIKDKDISKPINILIEGDNYHALSVLNFTHQGKVDVIYADPPYNTGNKSWKYNNEFVDKEDAYRHSKWLSFISKRIKLGKELLKDDGIFIITIDDYEIGTLRVLLDEIFGEENRLGLVTIMHNPRGRSDDKYFATAHEYALFYAKNLCFVNTNKLPLTEEQTALFNIEDKISHYRLLPLKRTGSNSTPKERANLYYPIYYNELTSDVSVEKKSGHQWIEILPFDSAGNKRVWRWGKEKVSQDWKSEIVVKKVKGNWQVFGKDRIKEGRKPKTVWVDSKYDASSHGTMLLQQILGKRKLFDYPKSLWAVIDCLSIACSDKKEAIVVDFFAGSGTTGHAVLELNKMDGGKRIFILNTNNENGICEDVCYPRIKNIMSGYETDNGKSRKGFGGSLRYFKTAFVRNSPNKDDIKIKITKECTEMLCLREGVFDEIKKASEYKILKQGDKVLAVYYSLERKALSNLKKDLNKLDGEKVLYCFTLDPLGLDKADFIDWDDVSLEPIPQKILDVYKQIYEY